MPLVKYWATCTHEMKIRFYETVDLKIGVYGYTRLDLF